MSTNNFEDTKNGIFVIEGYPEDEYEENLTMAIEDTIANIVSDLENKGYEVAQLQPNEYRVTGKSMDGKIGLSLQGGYYAGEQVIVTTQRDEQLMNANMEEEDITKDLYEFVDEQGFSEYTDDESDFEDNPEYHLNEVLHNVLWYDDTYEYVLDDMLPDDKIVIDIVSQYTTAIKKVGNFSNGEDLYEKA